MDTLEESAGLRALQPAKQQIAAFCGHHHVRTLSVFGSVLRDDFQPDSDIDVLVVFEPEHVPGFVGLMAMQDELSAMLGRRVDLNTPGFLSPDFRDEVLRQAQPLHVAA